MTCAPEANSPIRRQLGAEPGRRLALGGPVGARRVEEERPPVAGGPGPHLDRLAAGEDEVDPGVTDVERFHPSQAP